MQTRRISQPIGPQRTMRLQASCYAPQPRGGGAGGITHGSTLPQRTTNGNTTKADTAAWFFIHHLTEGGKANSWESNVDERVSVEEKRRRLEAAIFLSPEGETSRKLAKLAGLADATEVRTLIRQINQSLDAQGRAYRIEEVAGGYAMMTRSHFAPWLRRLSYVPGALKLSQSALETLAVVAYRQPVLRANVEAIRGVSCSEVLKQLMELDLVRISGRSEDLGRPYLYGTTKRFLQMFGLRSADRLPRMAWVNQTQPSLSTQELADLDSESKESTVKKSFTGAALLEINAHQVDETLLEEHRLVPHAVDDDDDFEEEDEGEDDEEDDDFDDDDEEWDDDEDDLEDEEEADELEDEEDADWEEVDDDDDLDEDEEEDDEVDDVDDVDDDDDDWDDEEEEEEEEDWD